MINKADCFKWLQKLEPESVDLIATDVPYESLEKWRAIGTTTRLVNKWFPIVPNARLPELLGLFHRVLKQNTHAYTFADFETAALLKPIAEAAGFKFWKPLVWDKVVTGMGYKYRSSYEMIVFLEKGRRNLNDRSIQNVVHQRRLAGKSFYPSEKPLEIFEMLIEQSSNPGDVVVDPFLGSGTCAEAALLLDRTFAGCDILGDAVKRSRMRLRRLEAA